MMHSLFCDLMMVTRTQTYSQSRVAQSSEAAFMDAQHARIHDMFERLTSNLRCGFATKDSKVIGLIIGRTEEIHPESHRMALRLLVGLRIKPVELILLR